MSTPKQPAKSKVPTLQCYRGFAALLVVLYHTGDIFKKYFASNFGAVFGFGWAGVQFFFVLSGFIILWAHMQDIGAPHRFGRFCLKRAVRIYPIYWAVTLALLPLWLFIPTFGEPYHKSFSALFMSLILLPQTHRPHLVVGWTLTHEVLFYSIFATAILSRKIGVGIFALWFTGVIAASPAFFHLNFPWTFFFDANNLLFGFGMVAALLAKAQIANKGSTRFWSFVAGNLLFMTAAALIGFGFLNEGHPSAILLLGVASFLIVCGTLTPRIDRLFGGRRLMLFLGDASYSIYLVHYPVLSLLGKLGSRLQLSHFIPLPILFVIFGVIAVCVGALLHLFLERPLLEKFSKSTTAKSPRIKEQFSPQSS